MLYVSLRKNMGWLGKGREMAKIGNGVDAAKNSRLVKVKEAWVNV